MQANPPGNWDERWHNLLRNNATVRACVHVGMTDRQMAIILAEANDALLHRLVDVEMIAPKRYQLPDGREVVYRCPDHLVPLVK